MGVSERKATTAHGKIEYETVRCANCENEVTADDSVTVYIDPYEITCSGKKICDATHPRPSAERPLCPYCAESVFGYNRRTGYKQRDWVTTTERGRLMATIAWVALAIAWVFALLFAAI
jgi:hypothetical protein